MLQHFQSQTVTFLKMVEQRKMEIAPVESVIGRGLFKEISDEFWGSIAAQT